MSFAIVCDVTCDLSREIREKFDIDYIKGHWALPDGSEMPTTLDWDAISSEEFYSKLRKNPDGYHTSPPSVMEIYEHFKKYVEKGTGIFYTCMTSAMSGTFDFATSAKEKLLKEYPDAQIYLVDSRKFATGAGLLAVLAAVKRSQGVSLYDTYLYAEAIKPRIHQAGWHDDLAFTAKKGRISNAKAFMGTLIGIKPVGDFSESGLTTVLCKVKGEKTAFRVLLDYIGETIEDPENQIILVAGSDRKEQSQRYLELIKERYHPKEIYYTDIFRASGTNAGPGIMAAYYVGKPLSKDLKEETEIYERLSKK